MRTLRSALSLCVAVVALTVVSCRLPEPPRAGPLPVTIPEGFTDSGGPQPVDRWWEAFGDPDLNALIERALSDNLDLQLAWARLDEARALARREGADLWPQLSGQADAAHTRFVADRGVLGGTFVSRTNQFGSVLAAGYEVDLWGRIRSSADAAAADARASRADVEAAAISVAASVGEAWFALAEQVAQRRLLDEQLEVSKTFLDLAEVRFGQGQGSALDVYQQKTQLAAVQGQIPLVESRLAILQHQLAVLVGQPPRTPLDLPKGSLPTLHAPPATGLPADLLRRRPDLRVTHERLAAADGRTAAAAAALLPRLSLSGSGGYQSSELHELFNRGMWGIAAGLTAPIFEGGRLRAEVERTKAAADERLQEYGQIVLLALREVEDALAQEARQRDHLASLDEQVELANSTLEQAQLRYRNGLNDYLPVLTALQALQKLQRDRLTAHRQLISFRIQLYRALGGAWPNVMKRGTDASASTGAGGTGP